MKGWTIGAGAEWALWQNWSGRIEYRYSDFDSFSHISANGGSTTTDNLTFHTVRAGLTWRFGDWGKGPVAGKGPVVARY